MLITLSLQAFALDCAGLNAASCEATNQVAAQVNLAAESTVITESASEVRLRESSIYATFEALRTIGDGSSCDVSGLVGTGTVGGSYRVNGPWSGAWSEVGGPGGEASGRSKTSPKTFWGTLEGNGTVGNLHSTYTPNGRILGNVDDGFAAGEWIRTAGRMGVFFVLYGDCPGDEQQVFADWLTNSTPAPTNQPPTVTSVAVTPSPAFDGDTLTCAATASDPDGDPVSVAYAWTVEGVAAGTGSTLSGGFERDDVVVCTATPNDGTVDGTPGTDAITIANSVPSVASVTLSPTSPVTADDLTCSYTGFVDADGDPDESTFFWARDGILLGETGNTLSSSNFTKNDEVSCFVTPFDGTDTGTSVGATVTIGNTAPTAPSSVSVTPSDPTPLDALVCTASGGTDADGDTLTYQYSWFRDGSLFSSQTTTGSSTLSASQTADGDVFRCEARRFDGTDSSAVVADTVTIGSGNQPPSITSITVDPAGPTVADTLTCQVSTSDPNGDLVTVSYTWTVNGSVTGTDSATLSSGYVKGDEVTCTATPNDGTVNGASDADTTLILNAAPTVANIVISPSSPVHASTLSASSNTSDADGDSVSVAYAWFVNGAQVSSSPVLTIDGNAEKGDAIRVDVTPDDGEDFGSTGSSAEVTVGNTAPTAPTADATDDPAADVDDIVCELAFPATDVDAADTITYSVTWTADGLDYPDDFGSASGPVTTTHTDDTVPAVDNGLASEWTCTLTATDGTASASDSDTTTVVASSSSLATDRSDITLTTASSYETIQSNFLFAQQVTFPSAVTVTGLGVNYGYGVCSTCGLAIYQDSAGPGALVGEGTSSSCGSLEGGTNEVDFGTSFSVPAGTYWLAANFADCVTGGTPRTDHYIASQGPNETTYYQAGPAGAAFPDPWGDTTTAVIEKLAYYPLGY